MEGSGIILDRLGYARHDCLCPYQYGRGAAVRPQTNDAIWDGVIGLWGRVAPLLSPWCARGNVPTGVNLNRYSGSGSCIPWHSDNESLFGPPNQPKLMVTMSLGHSVVFQVRRAPGDVPSSITLDHGDLLVMDGSAQSEYAHRTVSGLQGLTCPSGQPLDSHLEGATSQWSASIPPGGAPLSRGRARWVGGRRWRLS